MEYQAIVLAAGEGKRAQLSYNKVLFEIEGESIVFLATKNFIEDTDCKQVLIVCQNKDLCALKKIFKDYPKVCFVEGGSTRQKSVYNALLNITAKYVLVHDGARPYFSKELLKNLKNRIEQYNCVIPVIDSIDSLKIIKDNIVVKTINRLEVKRVQTPQAFLTSTLIFAHKNAKRESYTDDSAIVEDVTSEQIYVIDGEEKNIKYTNPQDF